MKLSSEKVDVKKTYLAVTTMLMAILCVDLYMVVIKFLGDEYSVIQLTVFRNAAGIIPLILLIIFTKEYFSIFRKIDKKFLILILTTIKKFNFFTSTFNKNVFYKFTIFLNFF